MNSIQSTLWNQNYRGEGDCAELETYLKKLDYGSRTGVSYLPWAVVERIFKMQGGEITLVPQTPTTVVEVDKALKRLETDENGVVHEQYAYAYFINVTVKWLGLSYTERYPLQDSSGRSLMNWTQNDINKAFQRAKVKAIANISGIGYKLFESGDLQFDDDTAKATEEKAKEKTVKQVKEKLQPAKKTKAVPVPEQKDPGHPDDDQVVPDDVNDELNFNRKEYENSIKEHFISSTTKKQKEIKDFLSKNDTTKIHELNDEKLIELFEICQKEE